ncbi:transposase [Zongyangia sp. HA2173]|jgi:HAMP domain-containing protein|uniref:IS3 family transposase n=1 Tax=Zongyangia sp. HA2173 TaxID=3133035 RepID=UPI00174B2AEE
MIFENIYDDSEQIYGTRKITAVLRNQEIKTSKKYVSEMMKELESSSVSTTAKKEYKNGRKGKIEISCNSSFKPNGQTEFGLAILLLLSLNQNIIISVLSLICSQERSFPIESLRIAVHNYSLKRLSKSIPRENQKRNLCFIATGEHSICLTHSSTY